MFLSPAEKLLALRKKYKITQGELVGDDITRVFLGMIEIGKRSLTEKTAKILCKNFDEILRKKGIKEKIDIVELMKSKEIQAIEYLDDFFKQENVSIEESIWNIEEALYEISETDRTKYCLQLFDKFVSLKEYKIARNYLLKSMHRLKKADVIESRLLKMFEVNEIIGDYKRSIFVYRIFKEQLDKEKLSANLEKVFFHYSKALIECGEYDEAFEFLKLLMKKVKDDDFIYEIRKVIAQGFWKMGELLLAAKEYTSLAKGRRVQDKVEAYANVIKIALEAKDLALLKKFYDKCKANYDLGALQDEKLNFEVLIALAKGANKLEKTKDSKALFMEALMLGKNNNFSIEKRMEIISELFQIFEKSDFFSVQSIEKEYFSLLKEQKDYMPGIKILEYYYKTLPAEIEKKFKMFD